MSRGVPGSGPRGAVGASGWTHSSSRRQFLARGGAAVGVLATAGLIGAGRAEANPQLLPSPRQLAVVGGLVSTILVATGQTGDGSSFGLLTPAGFATGFANVEPSLQTLMLGALDAVETAPAAGRFSLLPDARRQAFMRQALGELRVNVPPDPAFAQLLADDYAAYVGQLGAGKLVSAADGAIAGTLAGDLPDPPAGVVAPPELGPAPPAAGQTLAAVVLAGLRLVAFPLPLASPLAPVRPAATNDLLTSLATVLSLNAHGALDETVGRLVDQLVQQSAAASRAPDPPAMIPSRLLPLATAAWLS